ncbi:uncharacterized protein BKA78DRAFT_115988 [Phyllosticta capitalensis]|uniref:uncharacterized protein n=1 Tax=Phyllosticta capitalensis TaxID=121624 RepID=UPI00312EB141
MIKVPKLSPPHPALYTTTATTYIATQSNISFAMRPPLRYATNQPPLPSCQHIHSSIRPHAHAPTLPPAPPRRSISPPVVPPSSRAPCKSKHASKIDPIRVDGRPLVVGQGICDSHHCPNHTHARIQPRKKKKKKNSSHLTSIPAGQAGTHARTCLLWTLPCLLSFPSVCLLVVVAWGDRSGCFFLAGGCRRD